MTTFRGNCGNLMQHWVLCETLMIARRHCDDLTFIDAHSMAPIAIQRTEKKKTSRRRFDSVFRQLPGQGSAYEKAWKRLSPEFGTYANSAKFVAHLWPRSGIASMLLCESNRESALMLRKWARRNDDLSVETAFEDWRSRFNSPLPGEGDLTLMSFDPYSIHLNRGTGETNKGNLYPHDLDRIVNATNSNDGRVMMQVSSYSNREYPLNDVERFVTTKLTGSNFKMVADFSVERAGKDIMMSLIYCRNVEFSDELSKLPGRFDGWFNNIPSETSG